MPTLSAEFKVTDLPRVKEMFSILADMLGDSLVPTVYKGRIADIIGARTETLTFVGGEQANVLT